mgnify:CR=1 FL=1
MEKEKKKFTLVQQKDYKIVLKKKGVVSKLRIVTPKKPNSARRKVARVKLSTKYTVSTKVIGQGHNLQSYSHVLVRGGRANDLPGVRYTLIKGVLDFSWEENSRRAKSRSKYGISLEHLRISDNKFFVEET